MRIVARDAWLEGIVSNGVDLGKARRPRGIIGMADRTEFSVSGGRRFGRAGGLDMLQGRAMTSLACQGLVVPTALLGYDVPVAVLTGDRACELRLFEGLPLDSGRLMQVSLDELARDQEKPRHERPTDDGHDDNGKTPDLLGDSQRSAPSM